MDNWERMFQRQRRAPANDEGRQEREAEKADPLDAIKDEVVGYDVDTDEGKPIFKALGADGKFLAQVEYSDENASKLDNYIIKNKEAFWKKKKEEPAPAPVAIPVHDLNTGEVSEPKQPEPAPAEAEPAPSEPAAPKDELQNQRDVLKRRLGSLSMSDENRRTYDELILKSENIDQLRNVSHDLDQVFGAEKAPSPRATPEPANKVISWEEVVDPDGTLQKAGLMKDKARAAPAEPTPAASATPEPAKPVGRKGLTFGGKGAASTEAGPKDTTPQNASYTQEEINAERENLLKRVKYFRDGGVDEQYLNDLTQRINSSGDPDAVRALYKETQDQKNLIDRKGWPNPRGMDTWAKPNQNWDTPAAASAEPLSPTGPTPRAPEAPTKIRGAWRDELKMENYRNIPERSLREIMGNPRDAHLFGLLLQAEQDTQAPALADSIKNKAESGAILTEDEHKLREYARWEFSKRIVEVEAEANAIAIEQLRMVAERNPGFRAAAGESGYERIQQLFKEKMLEMGMKNWDEFKNYQKAQEQLHKDMGSREYEAWNREANLVADELGVHPNDIFSKFDMKNRADAYDKMNGHVRKEMRGFRRVWDQMKGVVGLSKGDRLLRRVDKLNMRTKEWYDRPTADIIKNIQTNLDVLSGVLNMTIVNDPQVRHMLAVEATRGTTTAPAWEQGAKSYTELRSSLSAETSDQAIQRGWEDAKKTAASQDGRKWEQMSQAEREAFRSKYDVVGNLAKRHQNSFWGSVVVLLARAVWGSKKIGGLSLDNPKR